MYDHYEALIFDLDGTLSNTLYAHESAWHHALTRYGIPFTATRMEQLGGVPIRDTVVILAEEAGMQVEVDTVVAARDAHFYRVLPATLSPTPLVEEVVLPHAGKKLMAVGTGCQTEMARRILDGLGIAQHFPVVVGADQVQRPKPWPDTFLQAAAALGVAPERCLVFEDADAGIRAARAAGMAVVDVRGRWAPPPRFL